MLLNVPQPFMAPPRTEIGFVFLCGLTSLPTEAFDSGPAIVALPDIIKGGAVSICVFSPMMSEEVWTLCVYVFVQLSL